MGEFVGIDPRGADQLIRQLESGKDILGRARRGLEAAIAEAGASWTGAQGAVAMHRSWAFFDDSQRDLKWRVDTLKQMVPGSGTGLISSFFAFDNEAQAAQQGKTDAAPISEALKRHEIENTVASWRKVAAATGVTREKLNDPAYAASLLAALGPERFRALFMHWMKDKGSAADRGLPPAVLQQGRESLGPLAEAYANAERAGRLSEEWRGKFMESTPPGVLTALVAMSKPSSGLLNQVAQRVLGRPLGADLPTSPNWNLNALVDAYDVDPQALQTLLADNKDAASWLLHPQRARMSGIAGLEGKLAGVLDKALKSGAGADGVRDRAWFNIIRGMGAEDTPWIGGSWGPMKDSPISETLAKNVAPYLDQLARGQSKRDSPELKAAFPTSPWDALAPDDASRFMGGLMQDKDAANALMKASQDYTLGLDIGRFRPFGDEATQDQYTSRAALAGGAANLMLSGSTHAEWTDDEYADWLAGVALLPISWVSNKYWPIQDATVATGRDAGLDEAKDGLKGAITDYFDKKTPATAEDVAKRIVQRQAEWVNESLNQHAQKPLTDAQQNEVRMAFRGRLYDALLQALKQRGG
ncbi:hypothetical protein SAMN05444920_1633 [Nonomuraea solani]|uniref:Uncharacterized protein n=1 Tax=Nonomuraea solani TaxID=1144553 RepID=A0A1H6F527_9ACTN|nr:hypothetical protein [Nonomuraea solani]SEH04125.1 hypothetical protein SAMN05444920_1633 [Nonomuraea solani]